MNDVKTIKEMKELISQGFGILFNKQVYTRIEDLPTESEIALATDDSEFVEKTKQDALAEIKRLQEEVEKLSSTKEEKVNVVKAEVKAEESKKKEVK